MAWLAAAARLPSRALHVAIMLAFLAGLAGRHDRLKLAYGPTASFGLDRHAVYRALLDLEHAGLITVVRAVGRAPVVSLVWTGGCEGPPPQFIPNPLEAP